MRSLTKIVFERNNLQGTLPDYQLPNMEWLQIGGMILNSPLPSFDGLPQLKLLALQELGLSGSLPSFAKNKNLQQIRFPYNKLTGTVPNFSNLTSLVLMVLTNNHSLARYHYLRQQTSHTPS